jgi:hypothetical protein
MMTRTMPAIALAASLLAGCRSGEPRLVPVSGTLTLNGRPFEGAEIEFMPDPGNTAITPGTDVSGPEGNYKIMHRNRSGLAPGKYRVVITKKAQFVQANVPEDMKDDPYMVALGRVGLESQHTLADEVKGSFEDREVPEGGGVLDFDVKVATKKR